MARQVIKARVAPLGHYSPGIKAGQFIFTAQVGHTDPATGKEINTLEGQTRQTIENVREVLEASGASLADVVSTTVYLPNIKDFPRMNEVWKEYFPKEPPSRATVSAALVKPQMLIEIQAIAFAPGK